MRRNWRDGSDGGQGGYDNPCRDGNWLSAELPWAKLTGAAAGEETIISLLLRRAHNTDYAKIMADYPDHMCLHEAES
eukprot:COSAG02_NODE_35611_length_466_cov_0.621253_1_plen_76_part_10